MPYQDYKQARDAAWQMLIDCHITSLPVDIASICSMQGYVLRDYRSGEKAISALGLSRQSSVVDGFTFYSGKTYYIFYNDYCSPGRQRFTIGHELGHITLGHLLDGQFTTMNREPTVGDAPEETQANQFAARILAPACVLHALNVRSAEEIAQLCGVSRQAAEFRMTRLRVLEQRGKYFTSPLERQVYEQFIPFLEARSQR